MVNQFREELARGAATEQAVRSAVSTAGRTIVYSGSTVIAALAALLIFPLYFYGCSRTPGSASPSSLR